MEASNNRIFTIKEVFHIMGMATESFDDLKIAKENGLIDDQLQDKIMLTVTDVNGCELCRVFHTKNAQKHGMSEEEVEEITSVGFVINISEEAIALNFARLYSEKDGKYTEAEWDELVESYGEEKAKGILGAIRVITAGNAIGIPLGAFGNRLKLKPVKGSTFWNEISTILCIIPFSIFFAIKKLFKRMFN